jgi:hypothetical protein
MWDMALHYPLLFPYGENGWHSNIPFNGVVVKDVDADLDEDHVEEFEHKKKHYNVTMAEFNGYRLQHRDIDGIVLLRGGRLRQQYIVDAYAAIEQNRLRYLHLNRKSFVQISIKAFRIPSLQVTITLLPSDKGSFYHLFSHEVHVTWFIIIKMPWKSIDGLVARMRLLHSLVIPNGLRLRECYCSNSNLKSMWQPTFLKLNDINFRNRVS